MKTGKITVIVLLAACALIIIGILAGQPEAVMAKAARICMECVGIG